MPRERSGRRGKRRGKGGRRCEGVSECECEDIVEIITTQQTEVVGGCEDIVEIQTTNKRLCERCEKCLVVVRGGRERVVTK
jgi:hypothetical protein